MNFRKIFEDFLRNGEKDTPFFQNFPKEIHRIANFGSGAHTGPIKITYREGAPISNAPYKQHLGKIGDFDGGPL